MGQFGTICGGMKQTGEVLCIQWSPLTTSTMKDANAKSYIAASISLLIVSYWCLVCDEHGIYKC